MRKFISKLLIFAFLASAIVILPANQALALDYSWIKVKLSVTNATSISMGVSGGYFINENGIYFTDGSLSIRTNSNGTLTVTHSTLGDIYSGSSFSLKRANVDRTAGSIRLNSRNYLGHFNIRLTSSGYIQVVNEVPLAHYLYGVVNGEMNDVFPMEALKAQAIAAKCYVLTGMTSTGEYYIGDTSNDQVYKGYDAGATQVIAAVDSTLQSFLTVNGALLRTYFAASNGGETKLVSDAWSDRGGNAGYAISIDDYDMANPQSPKETLFFPIGGGNLNASLNYFLITKASQALGVSVASVDYITAAAATTPRYNGVTRDMTIMSVGMVVSTQATVIGNGFGQTQASTVPGTQVAVNINFYMSELLSAGIFTNSTLRTYWGENVAGGYNLYHVRYGHGVGLSQRGAQQRASAGMSCQDILAFYYPGAVLSTIPISAPQNPTMPAVAAQTAAVTGTTFPTYGVTTTAVNFRYGPATSYGKIEKLAKDTQLILYGYENGWYQASCNGVSGYVSADYVSITAAAAAIIPTPTPIIPVQTDSVHIIDQLTGSGAIGYGQVTGSGVNFRTGPSSSFNSLGKLTKGTQLTLISKDGSWYKASTGTQTGYISASYVEVYSASYTPVTTTPTQPTSVNTTTATIGMGVTTGKVNFRSGPSTSSKKLGQLAKGTTLTLYALSDGWYNADANGTKGYVSAKYVKITSNAVTVQTGTTATQTTATTQNAVTTGKVNFRDKASTSGKKLSTLAKGTSIVVISHEDGWYYAEVNGTRGYVSEKYVKLTSATVTPVQSLPVAASQPVAPTVVTTGTTTAPLIYRDTPSNFGVAIMQLARGTVVNVCAQTNGWYYVGANGRYGYVDMNYITLAAQVTIPDISSLTTSTTTTTGLVASTVTTTSYGVTTAKVNLRSKASTSGSKVYCVLSSGTTVSVISESGDWYYVEYNGQKGYMYKAYVRITSAGTTGISTTPTQSATIYTNPVTTVTPVTEQAWNGYSQRNVITSETAYLRSAASVAGSITAVLPAGAPLVAFAPVDGWCLAVYNGTMGYINTTLLILK